MLVHFEFVDVASYVNDGNVTSKGKLWYLKSPTFFIQSAYFIQVKGDMEMPGKTCPSPCQFGDEGFLCSRAGSPC